MNPTHKAAIEAEAGSHHKQSFHSGATFGYNLLKAENERLRDIIDRISDLTDSRSDVSGTIYRLIQGALKTK